MAGYRVRGRVWIEGVEGTFLGYGRVVLLERVEKYGSISAAAKSMKMSYRHAWDLVDSMNRQSSIPLVEKATGGKGGGGTVLTPAGIEAIRTFRGLWRRFQVFCDRQTVKLELPGPNGPSLDQAIVEQKTVCSVKSKEKSNR